MSFSAWVVLQRVDGVWTMVGIEHLSEEDAELAARLIRDDDPDAELIVAGGIA